MTYPKFHSYVIQMITKLWTYLEPEVLILVNQVLGHDVLNVFKDTDEEVFKTIVKRKTPENRGVKN